MAGEKVVALRQSESERGRKYRNCDAGECLTAGGLFVVSRVSLCCALYCVLGMMMMIEGWCKSNFSGFVRNETKQKEQKLWVQQPEKSITSHHAHKHTTKRRERKKNHRKTFRWHFQCMRPIHKEKKLCECMVFIYLEMRKQVPHPKKIYKVIRHFYREFVFSFANIASLATAAATAANQTFLLSSCLFSAASTSHSSCFLHHYHTLASPPAEGWPFSIFTELGPILAFLYLFACVRACVWVEHTGYELSSSSSASFVAFCSFRFFENNILERKCSSWMHTQQKLHEPKCSHKNGILAGWAAVPRTHHKPNVRSNIFQAMVFLAFPKTYGCCYYYCYVYENAQQIIMYFRQTPIFQQWKKKKTFIQSSGGSSRLRYNIFMIALKFPFFRY